MADREALLQLAERVDLKPDMWAADLCEGCSYFAIWLPGYELVDNGSNGNHPPRLKRLHGSAVAAALRARAQETPR